MIQRIKNLTKLKGKKRYIVLAFLAVELMSLPAAAHIVHSAATHERPVVTAVEIPTAEAGISRFLVLSNSGFDVTANDFIGDVSVNVQVNGNFAGSARFGDAAQLPGPQSVCAQATDAASAIYKACLLYTSPSPRDGLLSRMPSSA